MTNFIAILNIVLPVFLVIGLGALLKYLRLINEEFLQQTNRLVFYVALPLLLFYKIGTADFRANFDARLVLGSSLAIVLAFFLSYGYATLRGYAPAMRGAFSQGAFRGNLAYVGLAIAFNAYGEPGLTRAGILMGFLVPVLNLCAISALLLPQRGNEAGTPAIFWVRQLALNPLIIASFLGIAWSFFNWSLPVAVEGGLRIVGGMTLPLALLAIGGSFSAARLRGDLVAASIATLFKLIGVPLLAAFLLTLLGVEGINLAVGIVLAGTPSATANYILAHQLKGDAQLSGSIIMLSTLASALSYTLILLLLGV
ncbi:MAG: AEC family transporter [Desulfuromonadales bacterium]|nr:AEC family transporter [Desulfuromonadales bacterium]MDT8422143.1 AEC family transporter [Desulfuromonadales bacterium]